MLSLPEQDNASTCLCQDNARVHAMSWHHARCFRGRDLCEAKARVRGRDPCEADTRARPRPVFGHSQRLGACCARLCNLQSTNEFLGGARAATSLVAIAGGLQVSQTWDYTWRSAIKMKSLFAWRSGLPSWCQMTQPNKPQSQENKFCNLIAERHV